MKASTAIDIALKCMDEVSQLRLQGWREFGNETAIDERQKIFEAMRVIKALGAQGRMEI